VNALSAQHLVGQPLIITISSERRSLNPIEVIGIVGAMRDSLGYFIAL